MVRYEDTNLEFKGDFDNWMFKDPNETIIRVMKKQLNKRPRLPVNWDCFKKYCSKFWNLPKTTMDRAIAEVKAWRE